MGTKKKTKTNQIKARKKKKKLRFLGLTVITVICLGFLIFFFVSLFDYVYPPTTGTGTSRAQKEKRKVTLYFSDENERFLVPETRYIPKEKKIDSQAEEIIYALIEGPKKGHIRTIPHGTGLIGVSVQEKGVAVVNFKKNIIDLHPGSCASEMMTIYSLTNTLIHNIPSLRSITLRVEGKRIKTLKGHIDTGLPFVIKKDLFIKGSA